ncbi:MAG: TolC family protein [Pseudomonadota bacterium]
MVRLQKLRSLLTTVSAVSLIGLTGAAHAITLEQAVRAAVTTNPTSKAADANVRASAMELLQLEREYMPSVSLYGEVGGTYFDDADRLNVRDQRDTKIYREVGIVGELTLFDGYRRANMVYQNAAALDGSIFRLMDASETMALNAVEAYIDVLRHRSLLNVTAQNIARHRDIIRQVEDLIDAGRLPASTGFEAQERLLAAQMSQVEVRQALFDANSRFLAVVGKDPDGHMHVPFVKHLPLQKREFVIRSVRNNFRLKQFESGIQAAEFDERIQTSDELPQVRLQAGARHGREVSGTQGSESDVFVGLRADWEFYAGGRKARERALQHRTSEARAERDAVRREVFEMAERTWHAYDANIERTVLLSRRLSAARQTSRQYEEQFQTGSRSLIDVLDAEATVFNVQFEKVSAEASFTFSQYRLLASQGLLAKRFNVTAANVPLNPDFVERATSSGRPQSIFKTEIKALE